MNPTDCLIAELEQESASTRRVLESVAESTYDWQPHPKGMSMAELCSHVASSPGGMADVLAGESFDLVDIPPHAAPPSTKQALLEQHDEAIRHCQQWIAGLGEKMNETWRLLKDGQEVMALPRAAAIRSFVLNHTYHHRGQLTAYLRATDQAVPSVYGPTADIDPFA